MEFLSSKKLTLFFPIIIIATLLVIFFPYYLENKDNNDNSSTLLLLIADNTALNDPIVQAWKNTAQETGILLTVMHDSQYLRLEWHKHKNYAGIVLPDGAHKMISPALLGQLTTYLSNGGKLMLVFDSATESIKGRYFTDEPPFARFLSGIKYGFYQNLGTKIFVNEPIGNRADTLVDLGIPYGKFIPVIQTEKNKSPTAESTSQAFSLLTTYKYGILNYPHLVTNGKYQGQVLLSSKSQQLVAGVNSVNKGKLLFVNLPLGYLCTRTDCLLQQVFLKYFALNVCQQPLLAMVPQGVGGLILNIHVDSNADLPPLNQLKATGIFRQGPYSIDFTAGPDVNSFGDKLGMDLPNNIAIKKWIKLFLTKNYEIGNHGGWIHNYFGLNINDYNKDQFTQYLAMNDQVITDITHKKTLEYSAPVGNMPEWVVSWLQDHNFVSYYSTGNTGAAPTKAFTNGALKYKIWSFPILSFHKAASFEEFNGDKYTQEIIEDWLNSITKFVVNQHTIRLFYFHPHGIVFYTEIIKNWLQTTQKLLADKKFKWYTMPEVVNFLQQREKVHWTVEEKNAMMIISAQQDDSLQNQTWIILKNNCLQPTITFGDGLIKSDDRYWIISALSGKRLQFACQLPGRS